MEIFKKVSRGSVPQGDFHIHTNWTDGDSTVQQVHGVALSKGLKNILFSEHVRHSSETWFFDYVDQIRDLPKNRCHAYVGIETRVTDFQGHLDCTTSMVEACDLVIASVHRFPDAKGNTLSFSDVSRNEAVERELFLSELIIDNPAVDILGHPFGMSLKRYHVAPSEKIIIHLMEKAAKKKVAFEINSSYHPDPWHFIDLSQKVSCPISLGSDAHTLSNIGKIVTLLTENL